MAGNQRKDFSIRPLKQNIANGAFSITDSPNIDFTYIDNNLTGNLTLTGATTGTYGSSTYIPVVTVDAYGRITAISQVLASGGGGSASWGSIGAGTGVGSQTDLVTYLNANYYPLTGNPSGFLTSAVTSVGTGTGLTGGTITSTGTIQLNSKLAPADSLTGNSLKFLRVNLGETAVEYADVASGGGGGGRSYYLNGSVVQGTFGGITDMRQISPVPVIGTGTDFTINTNGYIKSFITDAGDPNKPVIPAGNWNFELWFSVNNTGGSPNFYVELSKYDIVGGTFTPISTSSATPTNITTTAITLYLTALSVPQTPLLLTDRLAVRVFVNHGGGSRVVTLHTQGPHLSQIITDFPSGIVSLNGLTAFVQNFTTPGTTGLAPNWSSASDNHTINIPLASAASVTAGLISKTDYDTFNGKQDALTDTKSVKIVSNNVELDGDNASPGNDKVYGTNGSGAKGWYNAATGGGINQLTGDVEAGPGSGSVSSLLKANLKTGSFGVTIDGITSVIQVGQVGYVVMPYAGTITGWSITANIAGNIQFDIWKAASAIPVLANSIIGGGGNYPQLSSPNQFITSTTMTSWTLGFAAGDVFGFYVNPTPTVKNATLTLRCTKS
jgi:hypothetical protein